MKMIPTCKQVLQDLKSAITQVNTTQYSSPIPLLYDASIGGHCRHIIEFFQCLRAQLPEQKICYDLRQRNQDIERLPNVAIAAIEELMQWLDQPMNDQPLTLLMNHEMEEGEDAEIPSNLTRELAFNIEHAIHHMAIIKIGMAVQYPQVELPAHFGVAPSTIRYQNQQIETN